jgi:aspartyl-tRNA synthetase
MKSKFIRTYIYNINYYTVRNLDVKIGFDRIVVIFAEEISIKDAIFVPQNTNALPFMYKSPSEVTEEQLKELHIKLRNEKES